jgi:hypothetical protein
VKGLNRTERRILETEKKKEAKKEQKKISELQKWLKSWTPEQKRLFETVVENEIIKNDDITSIILDKCFMSAIDDNIEIDKTDLKKTVAEANEYMKEYKEFLDEYKEEGFNMCEDQEIIKKITERIKELRKEKVDKAKGLKILKKEFNLPNAELSDLWIQSKGNLSNSHTPKKFIEEPEKQKFLNEVVAENEGILNKEIPVNAVGEVKKVTVAEIGDIPQKEIPVKEVVEKLGVVEVEFVNPNKSKLKVVNTITEIEGQFDRYLKSIEGVKTSQSLFKDIKELETYKESTKTENEKQKTELKEQIEELQDKLRKVNEDSIRENGFIEEVEEIFKM